MKYSSFLKRKGKGNKMSFNINNIVNKIFSEFKNNNIPIDIVALCLHFGVRPLKLNADSENGKPIPSISSYFDETEINQHAIFKDYSEKNFIVARVPDALTLRVHLAYHLASFYLFEKEKITIQELSHYEKIITELPTNSDVYKLALCILIPKEKLDEKMREYNIIPQDGLNDSDILEKLVRDFYVPKIDIRNRLKLTLSKECED